MVFPFLAAAGAIAGAAAHSHKMKKENEFTVNGQKFKTNEIVNALEKDLSKEEKKVLSDLHKKGRVDDLFKLCMSSCGGDKAAAMEMLKALIKEMAGGAKYEDIKKRLESDGV